MIELEVLTEVQVEADVFAKTQPIIHVSEMCVVSMYDVDVPAHLPHLQPKDSWIVSIVQDNESNSVAIRGPNKSSAKEHVSIFVDCSIPCKTFDEMRVEVYLVTVTTLAAKRHWA